MNAPPQLMWSPRAVLLQHQPSVKHKESQESKGHVIFFTSCSNPTYRVSPYILPPPQIFSYPWKHYFIPPTESPNPFSSPSFLTKDHNLVIKCVILLFQIYVLPLQILMVANSKRLGEITRNETNLRNNKANSRTIRFYRCVLPFFLKLRGI